MDLNVLDSLKWRAQTMSVLLRLFISLSIISSILSWFFSMVWDKSSFSFFGLWISNFTTTVCWRDHFSPLYVFDTLAENQEITQGEFIFNYLYFVLLICISVFMAVPDCSDCCGFIAYFQIRKSISLFFSLKVLLVIWGLLWFQINFRTVFYFFII